MQLRAPKEVVLAGAVLMSLAVILLPLSLIHRPTELLEPLSIIYSLARWGNWPRTVNCALLYQSGMVLS